MECISTVTLLINDNLEGKIQPFRGIRQGNPLSPYIFILCLEFLGRELVKQSKNPKNHIGIQTYRNGPKPPFLMFVDDCIIFAKATLKVCLNINKVLNEFCGMSISACEFS